MLAVSTSHLDRHLVRLVEHVRCRLSIAGVVLAVSTCLLDRAIVRC